MNFLERIQKGLVIFDGAMGTQIHNLDPKEEDYQGMLGCSEILNVTRPIDIQRIHEAYFEAGSDVVETNSFGSSEIVLSEYGIADRAWELSRLAAEIARRAADKYSTTKPRYVAGSVGPGTKLISLGQTTWDEMYNSYRQQTGGLLEGGVDLFIIETCQDPLQIKCAIQAAKAEMEEQGKTVPIIVSITVETTGTLLVGTEVSAAIASLTDLGIDILGMNCATGPDDMKPYIKQLSQESPLPIVVQPNAGLPQNVDGEMVYTLNKEDFAKTVKGFINENGVGIVGGCCGTTPEFIRHLTTELKDVDIAQRNPQEQSLISSLFSSQSMTQDPRPLFVGERTNTNGSKRFREILLENDYDGLVDVAREQVMTGAHALDLCVAYTGRDEIKDMEETLKRMVTQINLPLVIDTTEIPVMERALQMYGGKAIINSINLEDGEEKANSVCALAKRYGAAIIALTIDEDGMARTVDKKVAIAKRIYDIAVNRHGLKAEDLIYDPLTFTLGSGDETLLDSAIQTMEGIRQIKKELPGVYTILGLSNVSFGLAVHSRKVLNSVFLADCVEAGLDMAIVNVKHILPLSRFESEDVEMARNLIYNRGSEKPLFDFINYFDGKAGIAQTSNDEEDEKLPLDERIKKKVIQGSKGKMEELLLNQLETIGAIEIINTILIPAMKVVGELFGSGQMQLPFVLQSAEVMKYSVDILKPHMEKSDEDESLKIILATVRGDVHDIGKNLVDIILSNNGYNVYNLGIKCEIDTMLQKAEEIGADAIGMSGLLVKSTVIMKDNLEEMSRRGVNIPVLLGGAALTPSYVWDTCAPLVDGPVIYCSDAFEGLNTMNLLREGKLDEYLKANEEKRNSRKPPQPRVKIKESEKIVVDRTIDIPKAPFLGAKSIHTIDLDEVYGYLTEEVIFRGRWGYRRGKLSKEEYTDLIENTVKPEFEHLKKKAKDEGLFIPKVAYGYFECNSQGEDVIIYAPNSSNEAGRFRFPRQKDAPNQCIADYFYPLESGKKDIIALQVATVGPTAMEENNRLYGSNAYKDYLLFHGLSVETAEALAEYWHLVVRQELGITEEDGSGIQDFVVQKYRGSRYSFGYPACPDLAQNRLLCELVDSKSIGVDISEEDQMVPEQTTSAFVVHHPQAKYFTA